MRGADHFELGQRVGIFTAGVDGVGDVYDFDGKILTGLVRTAYRSRILAELLAECVVPFQDFKHASISHEAGAFGN